MRSLEHLIGSQRSERPEIVGNFDIKQSLQLTGDISPSQITADQNDYNPPELSTAARLRLNSDAARNITGLQGGTDGRVLYIHNVGSFDIALIDESALSTAANRFALTANLTLAPDAVCELQYDSTSLRWRSVGAAGGGGGAAAATQAEMEAVSSTTVYTSPGRQHFHPGSAKGFVKWNGSTSTIDASYGVTSLTDNGIGDFTVNFATAFSSANYAPSGMVRKNSGTNGGVFMSIDNNTAPTVSALRIKNQDDGATLHDGLYACLSVFGDQ
ncbi:hypothetical protein [Bradyrhizobium sp.]|uniref:hypothetical protein n=1 Tax=Bradyrhizobium sp. TaxID=376 RepID=UPI0025B9551D|nr:hypothetical protein [Bradyrhizobium sp.]